MELPVTGPAGDRIPTRPAAGSGSPLLWDLMPRLILGGIYAVSALAVAKGLFAEIGELPRQSDPASHAVALLPRIATLLFMVVLVAVVAFRRRRVATLPGFYPRLVSVTGTFLLVLLGILGLKPPTVALPPVFSLLATALILAGSLLGTYVLSFLGRSFSIVPEARRLVTGGPYRWVRHPLYLVEELVIIGVLLPMAMPWNLLLLVAHALLQLERMRLEEAVLARSFPEYAAYARRTARLIPGIY